MAFTFGVSPAMFGQRRPTVSRQPDRYGQAPQGPLTSTLPQRPGMPMATATPVGQQYGSTADLYRRGGPGGGPLLGSGSGNVLYRDGQYTGTFADQENPAIARQQQYGAAAGSGPYDGSAGMRHFGPLAGQQQHVEQQVPIGTTYAGGSRVVDVNGRPVLMGPNTSEGEYGNTAAGRAGAINAAGGHVAYRSSGQPNELQQAAIDKYRSRDQMMAANRNIRANQRYGAPLRADMFPQAQQAYAQQGGGPLGQPQSNPLVAGAITRNTIANEDGSTTTDWNSVAPAIFDNDQFRNNPQAAFAELQKQGFTSDDLAELLQSRRHSHGWNDPMVVWLNGMQSGGAQGGAGKGPLAAGGPLVKDPSQYGAPYPRGGQIVQPPPQQSWTEPDLTPEYFPQRPSAPPASPPRRRGGVPAFRPNF